jgi:hypothetical protein
MVDSGRPSVVPGKVACWEYLQGQAGGLGVLGEQL